MGLSISEIKKELESIHQQSFAWAYTCCQYQEQEACEVLQESYMKVFSQKVPFKGQSTIKTWFFGVIRYTALEHRNRFYTRRKALERWWKKTTSIEEENVSEEDKYDKQYLKKFITQALDQLPQRQKEIIELVFYQDMSLTEAAEVMNVSLGSAKTHYDRAKKKMKEILEKKKVA